MDTCCVYIVSALVEFQHSERRRIRDRTRCGEGEPCRHTARPAAATLTSSWRRLSLFA